MFQFAAWLLSTDGRCSVRSSRCCPHVDHAGSQCERSFAGSSVCIVCVTNRNCMMVVRISILYIQSGRTALMEAVAHKQYVIIAQLVAAGADIFAQDQVNKILLSCLGRAMILFTSCIEQGRRSAIDIGTSIGAQVAASLAKEVCYNDKCCLSSRYYISYSRISFSLFVCRLRSHWGGPGCTLSLPEKVCLKRQSPCVNRSWSTRRKLLLQSCSPLCHASSATPTCAA